MNMDTTHTGLFARQLLTKAGKIAVGGLLAATILCGLIALVLTLAMGAPSRDIIIITVALLVCTILIASGMRWLQLVGTLASIYFLYFTANEPFVSESLANPQAKVGGGYGHFMGDVIIIACILVGIGAGIAATLQNFRQSRQMPRWLPAILSAIVGIALGAMYIGAIIQPAAVASSTTFTNGVPTVHMTAGNFSESSVTIPKGSQLMLVDDTSSIHILDNGTWQHNTPEPAREAGAPLVSNIQMNHNSVEIGPFTVAGTYHIYCAVHPGMQLTIIVQ